MKSDRWKNYEPVEGVAVYDLGGAWPVDRELQVLAKVDGAEIQKPVRVMVDGVCALDLTTDQFRALRRLFAQADLDLRAASSPAIAAAAVVVAAGTEGRCESCSQPVRIGQHIVIEDEDTEDRVVLHAGPCPGEESN